MFENYKVNDMTGSVRRSRHRKLQKRVKEKHDDGVVNIWRIAARREQTGERVSLLLVCSQPRLLDIPILQQIPVPGRQF